MMDERTDGELFLHFEQLTVLAIHMAGMTRTQRASRPDFKLDWLVRPLIRRCRQKRFELGRQDVRWVVQRASQELGVVEDV